MKMKYEFNFRAIKPSDLPKICESVDVPESEVRAAFESVERDGLAMLRRKPVTVELDLPEFANNLPELARNVLLNYVAGYVKATYIDQFLPVGQHDWATLEAYDASRGTGGRRAEFDITKEQLEAAAESIGKFVAAGLGNKAAGDKFRAAVMGRFAKSAIMRNVGDFNETVLDKLEKWADKWLEHVATTEPDAADDHSAVYAMLTAKIKAHRGASVEAPLASIL